MNGSSSLHPHEMCQGLESVASNANSFNTISTVLDFFLPDFFRNKPEVDLKENCFETIALKKKSANKNEKLCRTFSPFAGTWDYSEVD